jgi:hypothetical protein
MSDTVLFGCIEQSAALASQLFCLWTELAPH